VYLPPLPELVAPVKAQPHTGQIKNFRKNKSGLMALDSLGIFFLLPSNIS